MITLEKHGHFIHTRKEYKVTQQHSQTEPQNITNRTTEYHKQNHRIHKQKNHRISQKEYQNITNRTIEYHKQNHRITQTEPQNITNRTTEYISNIQTFIKTSRKMKSTHASLSTSHS